MIKAVILDLDGTLADTMDDLLTAMNSMLKHLGYKERTRDELLSFINKGARLFVGRSLPEEVVKTFDDPIVTKALGIYSEYYSKCYSDKTHEYEGRGASQIKGKRYSSRSSFKQAGQICKGYRIQAVSRHF